MSTSMAAAAANGNNEVMQIVIHFCRLCEYRTYANRVIAELEQQFGQNVQCTIERTGDWKVFKIFADGQVIFDKAVTGRFPNPNEVPQTLKPMLS